MSLQRQRPDRFALKPGDQAAGYRYRWLNTNDRMLREAVYNDGWEICQFNEGENPLLNPNASGTAPEASTTGSTRMRGDVVLARMRTSEWEEKIAQPIRDARDRQEATLDTLVHAANERMLRAAASAGLSVKSKALIFREEVEA
jgi:hypothetical protein